MLGKKILFNAVSSRLPPNDRNVTRQFMEDAELTKDNRIVKSDEKFKPIGKMKPLVHEPYRVDVSLWKSSPLPKMKAV